MTTEPTLEVVYRWPSGREEVRYRRTPADSFDAIQLAREVEEIQARCEALGEESPYSIRIVDGARN